MTNSGKKKKKKSDDKAEPSAPVGMLDLREYFQSRVEKNKKPDKQSKRSDSFLFLTAPLEPKADDKKICRSETQTKPNGDQDSTAKGKSLPLQNDI